MIELQGKYNKDNLIDVKELNYELSYIYGFLLADGTLSLDDRNRGKVTAEVSDRDQDILERIYDIIDGSTLTYRSRQTNYSKGNIYKSCIFRNCNKWFRDFLVKSGFPTENKSKTATIPKIPYDKRGFWLGYIDGNGSIGIASGRPFISITTDSDELKLSYCFYLAELTNQFKVVNRDSRDNIYNIYISGKRAMKVLKELYEDTTICLNRRYDKYKEIIKLPVYGDYFYSLYKD